MQALLYLFAFVGICGVGILGLGIFMELPILGKFAGKVLTVAGVIGWVLVFCAKKLFGDEKAKNYVINMGIALVTIFCMLGLGELLVREALSDITTTQYSASCFSRKWASEHVRFNSWRFREKEFQPDKPHHVYRIAVIGDSFTFGQGIPEQDRYSNLLQAYLERESASFEVLNFGWTGVDTIREMHFLEEVLKKVEPNYILLQWFVNDVVDDAHMQTIPVRWRLAPSWVLHRYLNGYSCMYYLMNEQLLSLQLRLGLDQEYDQYYRKAWEDPESPDSKQYKQVLRNFIQKSKQADVPIGMVLFPKLLPDMDVAYPYGYLHELVLSVCASEHIECLDLRRGLAPFSKGTGYKQLHVNRLDTHPSSLVNEIAAKEIQKRFGPLWRDDQKIQQASQAGDRT